MSTVKVKNIEIGIGMPKICIPMTGKTREEILEEIEEIQKQKPDLAEWRVDCYEEGKEVEKTWEMLKTINDRLGEIPLIFTFRTAKEGGKQEISFADYTTLLKQAAETKLVDLIDVEAFFEEQKTEELIQELHERGVQVLASNHHFHETPCAEELVERMKRMEAYKADILKMAVMPKTKLDLYVLLRATVKIKETSPRPVVTMSMGELGVLSRISGAFTGSSITFAAGKNASAPGQIAVEKMRRLLAELQTLVPSEK